MAVDILALRTQGLADALQARELALDLVLCKLGRVPPMTATFAPPPSPD